MRNWEKLQKLTCLPNLIFFYNSNKDAESIVIISLTVQRGLNIVNMQNIIFVKLLVLGHLANVSKMGKTGKRQGLDYLGCIRGFLWAMLLSSCRGKEVAWCIKLNSSRMSCLFLFHIVINLDKTEPSDSRVQTGVSYEVCYFRCWKIYLNSLYTLLFNIRYLFSRTLNEIF